MAETVMIYDQKSRPRSSVRAEWADSLTEWPQVKADELDAQGLPASQVLKLALETAEKLGYEWPNRYQIK